MDARSLRRMGEIGRAPVIGVVTMWRLLQGGVINEDLAAVIGDSHAAADHFLVLTVPSAGGGAGHVAVSAGDW